MLAIFKREYKSYFISMLGYVFMSILLMVIGLCYYWINLHSANAFIGYSLQYSYVTMVFMVLVPVVTMKIFADEKRLKTDQLLLTSPVSVTKIVLGKFFAIAAVFAIPVLIVCIYPILLTQYGTVNIGMSYVSILGFFLMGLAYLSIGIFVSSLTENQIISAVVTFIILMLSFMVSSLVTVIPSSAIVSFIACIVIVMLLGLLVKSLMGSKKIGIIFTIVAEIAVIALYLMKSSIFEGLLQKILMQMSLSGYYENFVGGIFDLTAVVYYISVVILFLFLTVQSIQKRRWS
ncbi:MAG: ABC transporter [Lachnospiraceae bacterium]|nr:ABC transporter [Lachnospiraceae bacterium]